MSDAGRGVGGLDRLAAKAGGMVSGEEMALVIGTLMVAYAAAKTYSDQPMTGRRSQLGAHLGVIRLA